MTKRNAKEEAIIIESTRTTSAQKRCYTVDDLCVMLGMSRKSVYELLRRRELRWFRLGRGGHYRIVRESFEQWLSERM